MKSFREFITEEADYRGQHQAPDRTSGAPLHDVTANGIYPDDVYSSNGFRYYGEQGNDYDEKHFRRMQSFKGKPDEKVRIHRAIPIDVYKKAMKTETPLRNMIRPGDWVTISKEYAHDHGKSALNGKYKIASMRVRARDVYTNGDSHHEWGYDPNDKD